MHAYIYLISASYVSQGQFQKLADALIDAAPCLALAVRLEASGANFWAALDDLSARGMGRIELRPIGLPFSQSLETWIPNAAGSWLDRQGPNAPELYFAQVPQNDAEVVKKAARANVVLSRIAPKTLGEMGKGWDAPPAFRHHLLVCAGPRCHLKDAPNLVDSLKAALGQHRVATQCLVTTTGCLFPCNDGPVVVHYPHGNWYRLTNLAEINQFVTQALCAGHPPQNLLIHQTGDIHETA